MRAVWDFCLSRHLKNGEISLSDIWKNIQENEKNAEEMQQQLIPNVEIFKEIMVELIRNKEINMEALKKERNEFIQDQTADFQLNEMLLQLSEERFSDKKIGKIEVYRIEDGSTVTFDNVFSENGVKKRHPLFQYPDSNHEKRGITDMAYEAEEIRTSQEIFIIFWSIMSCGKRMSSFYIKHIQRKNPSGIW